MSTRLNDSEILTENPTVMKHNKRGINRHSHKTSFMRKLKRTMFRRKTQISGVRRNQIHAERRFILAFLMGAVLFLVILIPLILWIAETINTSVVTP